MATKKATPKKALLNIELVPDAWPRFENFIREIVKAGPQHRAPTTKPKVEVVKKERPASKGRVHKGKSKA